MNCNDFTFKKLNKIPMINWYEKDISRYDSVILVPMRELHDSGYMRMSYLFCKGKEIICRSDDTSDILHIDGFRGCGDCTLLEEIPDTIEPRKWAIDCLPNGYLRLFCYNGKIKNGNGLASYEIFADLRGETK